MARPDAAALAPFTLPLRREGDAAIVDKAGKTFLVIDPDRDLDDDAATRIADHVFEALARAPAAQGVELTTTLQSPKGPVGVDASIAPIVQALWKCGIDTLASCSGHTHRPGNIALADGRELIIARDYDEARKIDALFPLNICGEAAGEVDLYDDKVQAGIAWAMRQWGETLGLKTWEMGDGSESVEGDVGAEIHTILVDAGLRDPDTNEMAALCAQLPARPWGWDYKICTGCSASLTIEEIAASGKLSCCPDRRMVTVRDLVDAYDAQRTPPAREDAQARPTCQKCGGEIAGWLCQQCPAEFRENDVGALVFGEETRAP